MPQLEYHGRPLRGNPHGCTIGVSLLSSLTFGLRVLIPVVRLPVASPELESTRRRVPARAGAGWNPPARLGLPRNREDR